ELLKSHPDKSYSLQLLTDLWKPVDAEDIPSADKAFDNHMQRLAARQEKTSATKAVSRYRPPENGKKWTSAYSLLRNYSKTIHRNLLRSKTFSFINITGLAIGMASALIILLWVRNELSYDLFHKKKDRIYQVYSRGIFDGKPACWRSTPMVLGPVLKKEYPQVEEVVRMNWVAAFVLSNGDKHLQTQGDLVDPGFFRIFSFPLVQGDVNTALDNPHSIVLTETAARKLFGTTDVLGVTMRVDSISDFTVTGVLKDMPPNTRFSHMDYLVPWSYTKEVNWEEPSWAKSSITTYVLLKPGVGEQQANGLFGHIITAHAPDVKNDVFLHPLRKWRLYSGFENGKNAGGYIEQVRMFIIIAAFILLIACINYMNLSTARSEKRAREVGVRKVVGAGRGSLIGRFIGESILMAMLAGILALLIVQPILPYFNQLVEERLSVPYRDAGFWIAILGFILLTGLLAGSYPAFYLSGFRPIQVLKGHFKVGSALVASRKVLVVVQFTTAIAFIICTLVVYRQLSFARQRDTGYDKGNLAFVYMKGDIAKNYSLIRRELVTRGLITSITRTNSPVTDIWTGDDSYEWKGKDPGVRSFFSKFATDKDFVKTIGLKLVAGRDIDVQTYPTDSSAILLNEAAVRVMGLTDPVGQTVRNRDGLRHIVGVVRDFVPGSPFSTIPPIIVEGPTIGFGTITFRLNDKAKGVLAKISSIFTRYNPNYPFQYYLVEDDYALRFEEGRHFGVIAVIFAGLAIFISCLGLFALAAYMAENRIKEIGIRKVLGASVPNLTVLLTKEFLLLVLISFVIASPLAGWVMHAWLRDFSYHTNVGIWVFVIAGGLSFVIALGTVTWQSLQAALASPAKTLRME
ncbi:MAG TPA: ABC transporter permease, partial [Puia sp.]|nr:ABC transporter permease [Puia sp.]